MKGTRVPCLLSGLVLLAVLLTLARGAANGIVRGVDDFFRCSEHILEEIASPRGQYIAQVVVEGCGGAAGQVFIPVRLRSAVEEPDGKGQTVFQISVSAYGLSVYWEGEGHLIIEHDCYRRVDRQRDQWRDISISYRCAGPQEAHLCNACGSWRSP